MCCSRTPLFPCPWEFYSSQTEVNALQSNCVPASQASVFAMGWQRLGGRGAVRWVGSWTGGMGGLGLREMKNKLLAIIKRNGLRHSLLSMPPTLLSLSISSRVAISLVCSTLFSASRVFLQSPSPPLAFFPFPKIAF